MTENLFIKIFVDYFENNPNGTYAELEEIMKKTGRFNFNIKNKIKATAYRLQRFKAFNCVSGNDARGYRYSSKSFNYDVLKQVYPDI